MRVRRLSVAGLFGVFDHEIPLHQDPRITILHGQNGVGKTVVLRLLHGLLSGHYAALRSVPFTSFAIELDDGSEVRVEKIEAPSAPPRKAKSEQATAELRFTRSGNDGGKETFSPTQEGHRNGPVAATFDLTPLPDLVGPRTWQHLLHTRELMSADDVLDQLGGVLGLSSRDEPEWLQALHDAIPARLIQTQRLDVREATPDPAYGRSTMVAVPAVKKYSEDLAAEMQAVLGRYAATSQDLDRTFPARLLGARPAPLPRQEEIERRLVVQEQKRAWLTELGFLDAKNDLAIPPAVNAEQIGVLSIWVSDVEAKLGVFDELAKKIELFSNLIKSRFQYKSMTVRRDTGFVFTTAKGDLLPPTGLSSGEQHELVLLYELLFKVKPNSLILIDEPEISLHLAWQVEVLGDLEEIVKLSDFDVVVATHSADIIGSHWDLTVELKGPNG